MSERDDDAWTWLEDDEAFDREMRGALRSSAPAPRVPGCEDLREIGRGGQGVVYAATQTATRRRVAVKVLHDLPGRTRDSRRRFRRELETAAALSDPRLVAVFDGGETDDGRPFVVMELVTGAPLLAAACVRAARAAGGARPAAAALAALGAEIAEATAAAHRRGVVHRDLKPANLLVEESGRPRVLDFGLAKAVDAPADGLSATAAGSFLGSLPWASPEQAAGRSDAVDVRTDVYGLGAVLYHCVTGRPPVDPSLDVRAALAAAIETPPPPPSRLAPACDRDLEAVILRALEKDPERRYATAEDLARDLRAVAAGEPIAARRETAWRALAAAARRRGRLLLATTAAAALAVGAAFVATAGRREAEAESARARRTLDFLFETLGAADPRRDGAEAKLVDALETAARALDRRLAPDDGAEKLRIRRRLAELFATHGRFDRALEAAEAARAEAGDPGAPGSAEFRAYWRTELGRALALRRTGRAEEGLALAGEAVRAWRGAGSPQDPDLLQALAERAQAERGLGRLDAAAATLAEILAATEHARGPEDGLVARGFAFDTTAATEEARGRPAEALAAARAAAETLARCGPAHERDALIAAANLGDLLRALGRAEEGARELEALLPRLERAYGNDHPQTLATKHNLGAAYAALGRRAEAVKVLRSTWELRRAKLGATADRTLATLNEWAVAGAGFVPPEETEALLREVYTARAAKADGAPIERFVAGNNWAKWVRDRGRPAEAVAILGPLVAEAEKVLGAEHAEFAVFQANYGRSLALVGRKDEARPLLRAAAATLKARLGAEHPLAEGAAQFAAEADAAP